MNLPQRQRTRLQGYDYSQFGSYFVTLCTWDRRCLFGEIVDGVMVLNEVGRIVEAEWKNSTSIRNDIEMGEFVVMPDHFHGIVTLNVGVDCIDPKKFIDWPSNLNSGRMRCAPTTCLGSFVRGFKSAVTRKIREYTCDQTLNVWQRNYFDHIIRNQQAYDEIVQYIQLNPLRWWEKINRS